MLSYTIIIIIIFYVIRIQNFRERFFLFLSVDELELKICSEEKHEHIILYFYIINNVCDGKKNFWKADIIFSIRVYSYKTTRGLG